MTERLANIILELIGEKVVSVEGINFIAVVRRKNNLFELQIGFNQTLIENEFLMSEVYSIGKHILYRTPIDFNVGESIKQFFDDIEGSISLVASNFNFDYQSQTIRPGDGIYKDGLINMPGTLGAFLKLTNCTDIYLISNWHVIMCDNGSLGDLVKLKSTNKVIGSLYWGIKNEYYDIAIAKLNNIPNVDVNPTCFNFSSNLTKPSCGQIVKKSGYKTKCDAFNNSKIISTNTYVSVRNDIFKNQILIEKISEKGDSGSLMVDKKNGHPLGLVFGGDEHNYTVCNHIYKLFNEEIPELKYRHPNGKTTITLPKIKIESIKIINT